ncbi:lipase maturation factor family protein [Patescibacteria group bacterium]|nr:lipase maturation factor family protein [Patescibacteria group bacterium]
MSKENKKVEFPLLVYDGDCTFCRAWVDYWKSLTGDRVAYAPFQEVAEQFPTIPLKEFKNSVQLITPKGKIYSGAHGVFRTLALGKAVKWLLFMYLRVPGFAFFSELFYRIIARHRGLAYFLTKVFWGKQLIRPSYILVRWLFFRLFGVVYLTAFISLFLQLSGLVGSNGILPASNFLEVLIDNLGPKAFWFFPTVAWLNVSDLFLHLVALVGAVLSLLLIFGITRTRLLAALWFLYLSLFTVGQVFLSFQWDILLLEVGFLAILLTLSQNVIWLFRWLLFKFILMSGAVKLLSGDIIWRNFTALNFHYQTQPLPTPFAWYMHQLPEWFQKFSVGFTFFVELGIVFLIFAPRRLRLVAAFFIAGSQVLILLTGNYTFFNFLTIILCVFLLDDAFLSRISPKKFAERIVKRFSPRIIPGPGQVALATIAFVLVFFSILQMTLMFSGSLPSSAQGMLRIMQPFHIVNTYGLFAVMTTSRPELIIEGSNDGEHWQEYEFKYKPGDLRKPPGFVAPHQPRLDWQMWFAALHAQRALESGIEEGRYNLWFVNFMVRLLQDSPQVLKLLAKNPFPESPPRYVRALLYEYQFTDFDTKKREGTWWKRELKEIYLPSLSLQ